ncbi:glycosyl hydrolase family 71-domain-containing protein [Crassisporium funariophilum]|nr:glycosyl hydrolase family 71-domain-containing protein [Crassisporium funariophilum]
MHYNSQDNLLMYKLQDWAEDITLAHAAGIDGFALNMGRDEWQPARVADAYESAKQSGLDFKLFLSLDMSSFPCGSPNDAQTLRNLVNAHAPHPNQLQYASKAFVSTFAGESCNFGQGSVQDGWKTQFAKHPELEGKMYFVPAFFIDPAKFTDFADVMDGDFNWNSGWPIQVTTSFAQNALSEFSQKEGSRSSLLGLVTGATGIVTGLEKALEEAVASTLSDLQLALTQFIGATDTDKQHLDGLAALSGAVEARDGESSKRAYMGAVSPWFFTHYGPDTFNKNFVFLSDQHLYSKRWESLIDSRDQFDIVQVLTWNDYGESHYIGPIKGDQPNSEAWTDGMNHTAWLELTQYYATAFKTGAYPAIEKDKIIMWSRPHSTKAQSSDSVPQPTNFEILEDAVWAVVMTTSPSTVTLSTSPSTSKTFNVPAGVSKLAIPITPGGTMKGVIERNGQSIVELNPQEFTFEGSPKTYNFNAFVASATAD